MPLGLTRKEQWALLGTIGAIVATVGYREVQQRPGSDMVYVQGQGYWKRISVQEAKPPAGAPAHPAAPKPSATPVAAAPPIQPGVVPAASSRPSTQSTPLAPPPAAVARASPATPAAPAVPLDLNAATEQQLEALPGIGPVRAAAIVQMRLRLGRFTTVDQLDLVSGIGPATLAKLRPFVRVGPPAR